ncbi:hypothetical protein HKK55_10325 [Pseudomonas sp. ADAK18]|uniref:phospholipase D-like domain-containing protein n=1 Tax=Pseudomonas sp. ADAK18 TaxID=2730848 RepID=UPI0014633EAE|nr:phospholipase D-like domain-containing protein [Pseudomonas sp. ADAK18]QJI29089.1 hypothetical protein HKK55_10325 [Pseudomonas sp. ADAK18]
MEFTENIVPLITGKLKNNTVDLKIFSPYLTGDVALDIAKLGKSAKVFTLLNVQVLAFGSSCYCTIKALIDAKFEVYSVPNLHAKMIIADGSFITVGSQNFTDNGNTRSKEVSFLFSGMNTRARSIVSKLEAAAEKITPDFLEAVKQKADSFSARYETLKNEIDQAEIHLSSARKQSSKKERKIGLQVTSALGRRPQSNPRKCRVSSRYSDSKSMFQYSLMGPHLLTWSINKESHRLKPQYRYLCISKEGKIGWVRVNNTVYSIIEDQVDLNVGDIRQQPEWTAQVDASELARKSTQGESNLRVTVFNAAGQELCHVYMKYNISTLSLYPAVLPNVTPGMRRPLAECRAAIRWIDTHADRFRADIKRQITEPFKFHDRLTGQRADTFFGRNDAAHYVRLVDLGKGVVALRVTDTPM